MIPVRVCLLRSLSKGMCQKMSNDVRVCMCVCVAKIYKVASGGVIFKCCLTVECPMKLIMSL